MNENSFILKSINDQLGEFNREISKLQSRLVNIEACISNISETQATLINRMAAKPELVAPAETDVVAVFKTVKEKLEKLDRLVSKVEDLAHDVEILKIGDRKSTRLNSSHITRSRMPSSA